jgi:hypothetical protein
MEKMKCECEKCHMTCEKCGSINIKVDFNTSYTSNPEKYSYCCQDCGEVGFINCDDVEIIDININDEII